ncbi:MAG TPA: alpha/beta fold hydrolase [Jatrophihabitans sp.]|jgi:pimeloyl-ACP methyl ester carboxylesterase|nr:alpha/beta fold hydrolase [Jatrophihabitans sp.]
MPTIELPQGRLNYRVAGPEDSAAPPVVLIHGLLVNGELWTSTAAALAERGIRSYAPDLPLGANEIPLAEDADGSPRGVARLIVDFLAALDLHDVTLVGNDTGGALCQFVIDTDASRIGRLALTNCDAFDKFPPPPFGALVALGSRPGRLRFAMRTMRPKPLRHSIMGYGGLVAKPLDREMTARWTTACLADPAVARGGARFMKAMDKRELLDVSTRLGAFGKPVLLLWGTADPFFKISLAERLRDTFTDARLVTVDGAKAFVPLDEPDRVAAEIAEFTHSPAR